MGCGASSQQPPPPGEGTLSDAAAAPIANNSVPEATGAGNDQGDLDAEGDNDQDDLDDLDDMAGGLDEKLFARAKAIFDRMDTDGSGTISKAEFKAGLLSDEDAKALMKEHRLGDADGALSKFDLDGDGEITWMEFEETLMKPPEPDAADLMVMEASAAEQLLATTRAIFDRMDTDGDGSLTKAEIKAGLETDPEMQKLFAGESAFMALKRLDLDGDGEVSWAEFSEAVAG